MATLQQYAVVLIIIVAVIEVFVIGIVLFLLWKVANLQIKYKKFMKGKEAKNLEEIVLGCIEDVNTFKQKQSEMSERIDKNKNELVEKIEKEQKKLDSHSEKVISELNGTFQKMALSKYDAFGENGGKLSFSLCMLNEKNSGFILTSIHSKEGCYNYIKEIIDKNPIIILSEDEKEVLNQALGNK